MLFASPQPHYNRHELSWSVGKVINWKSIAIVIESKSPQFKKGDYIMGSLPWRRFVGLDSIPAAKLQKLDNSFPPSFHLGSIGGPGRAALLPISAFAKPKAKPKPKA